VWSDAVARSVIRLGDRRSLSPMDTCDAFGVRRTYM